MASGGPLRWVFELLDKVSGPAKSMETALTRVERALRQNQETTRRTGRETENWGRKLGDVALDSFVNLAERAWHAVKGIGEAFGETVIGGLAFKENTLASFEAILGSKQAAQDLFKEAARIARLTPFQTQDVVQSYSKLLGAGFNPKEVGVLNQAIGDVSALQGFSPEVFGGIIRQFAEFRAGVPVQMRHIQAVLTESSGAGIGYQQIGEQLAKQLGLATPQMGIEALHSGEVTGEQFMTAFVDAVAKKGGGGKVGTILLKQAGTLKGLWSNITSIPADTIFAFADNLKGMETIKGVMRNIIDLFDQTTTTGQRFQRVVENIVDSLLTGVFGPYEGEAGKAAIQTQMERFLSWAEGIKWKDVFRDLGTSLKEIADTVHIIVTPLRWLGTAFGGTGKFLGYLASQGNQMPTEEMYYQRALENGRQAQAGLAQGLIENMGIVSKAAGLAGQAAEQGTADALEVQSPSKVFAELGRYSALGYAEGLSRGMPDIGATLGDLSAQKGDGSSGGRGGVVHIHEGAFPIVVQGGGAPEDVARQLRPALQREIVAIFEDLGMEVGMEGAGA